MRPINSSLFVSHPRRAAQGVRHANHTLDNSVNPVNRESLLPPLWNWLCILFPILIIPIPRSYRYPFLDGGAMMLDPSAVVTGVASGYLTQKGIEKTNEVLHPDQYSPQHEMVMLLREILQTLEPSPSDAIEESMYLFPYPGEYIIDSDFKDRAHVCILFYAATPVRFDGIFGGSMLKTVGPGWVQVDQPGRLSTTDSQSHFVTISYRDDALGASF